VRRNGLGPRFDRTDYAETRGETTPIGSTGATLRAEDQYDRTVRIAMTTLAPTNLR
jgi:hypothetical protein